MNKSSLKFEPLIVEHISDFTRWINNAEAVKYSLSVFSPPRDESWVRNYILSLNSNRQTWDQVIVHKDSRIGYCGLCNISSQNHSAELYILIGDSSFWGNGLGTEAGKKVLEYGFGVLGLHRIWLTVTDMNIGAIKSYQKLGFKHEGIMKDAVFRAGRYHNKLKMGILSNEMHNKPKRTEEYTVAFEA